MSYAILILLDETVYSSYLSAGNFVVTADTLCHRKLEDNPGEIDFPNIINGTVAIIAWLSASDYNSELQ